MGRGELLKGEIWPEIKRLICITILAVKNKLLEREYRHCFEVFGYDFIIDEGMKVWLIEVNTNPCLEESSELLRCLMPRMINDALKLTIDKVVALVLIGRSSGGARPARRSR